MRRFVKNVFLILLSFSFLGFTGKEKFVELNGAMNARSTGRFTQSSANVLFTMGKNTKAEILGHKKFQSGNYGLKVRVSSGPHKNKVIWVYYNSSRPTLALYDSCPRNWSETGVAACKPSANPERANASVTVQPTPATVDVPEEIKTLETITVRPETADDVKAETQVVAQCTNCSLAARPQAPTQTFVDQLVATSMKSALTGANRVMADMYQSCHVLNLPPITDAQARATSRYIGGGNKHPAVSAQNIDEVANSHYYLQNAPEPVNPSCKDMSKAPPLYVFGGKPNVNNGTLDIFNASKNGTRGAGLDCSGFLSAALSVSGLKIRPAIKDAKYNLTNAVGFRDMNAKNSCFNRPAFSKDQTIQGGDVVAFKGHAYMIDRVGQDPFGIAKAKSKGSFPTSISSCSRFQPPLSDLDFTIIQSTGYGSLPAMKIEAKNYKGRTTKSYMNMAIQACKAQFTGQGNSDFIAQPDRGTPVTLLRHKGDSEPKCSFAKNETPRLAGEECTQGCFKEKL